MLKENLLALPALLKNKYFVKGKLPRYVLIPDNKNFIKGKWLISQICTTKKNISRLKF
jgi:hypothetical protein